MNHSTQLGFEALDRACAHQEHQVLLRKLAEIAQGLARMAGPKGVTVSDVRHEAVRHGILPQQAKGRQLAFLGALMREAGLVPTGEYRRSEVDKSHGNLHQVWRHG